MEAEGVEEGEGTVLNTIALSAFMFSIFMMLIMPFFTAFDFHQFHVMCTVYAPSA